MKFAVDLWLDGYDSEQDMNKACEEFIYDQLNFSGSGVKISPFETDSELLKLKSQNDKLKVRVEGLILSLQAHGQNIDVQFHIDWLKKGLEES